MRTGNAHRYALAALILAAAAQSSFSLEFGIDATTSNLVFPSQETLASTATFPTDTYFWGGEAWLTAALGDEALVRVSYDREPILGNTVITAVQFERGIARISVGPLIGFLNSDASPFTAGLSASVRLQWPGVAYVSLRSDGGTAISIFQVTDPQAQIEMAAGFYVPNAIVSAIASAKRFNDVDANGQIVSENLTRYAMTVDVFKKNVLYNAQLSMGYEQRTKYYAADPAATYSLGAIVLGIDTMVQIDPALALKAGISTGAYVFGLDALKGRSPSNSAFMFSANLGFAIDTAKIRLQPRRLTAEKATEAAPAAQPASPAEAGQGPTIEPAAAPEKTKPPFSRLALDAGIGLYYNDRIQLTGAFALLGAVFNARAGLWGSVGYRITPSLALGCEVGIDYITFTSGNVDASLYDIPILAKVGYSLGKVELEGFAGTLLSGLTSSGVVTSPSFNIDAGARVKLGGLYAEASYVFGIGSASADLGSFGAIASSYPRFGLGYAVTIK